VGVKLSGTVDQLRAMGLQPADGVVGDRLAAVVLAPYSELGQRHHNNDTRQAAICYVLLRRGQPPFVVGIDGVGKLDDGPRVYFLFPRTPFGGWHKK
jgi:hypothetical protein